MTPKGFQKSNLAIELKAGKKRLEDALHGLSDEQCERAGATRSGSVVDLLSEIVTKEFLATHVALKPMETNEIANKESACFCGRELLRRGLRSGCLVTGGLSLEGSVLISWLVSRKRRFKSGPRNQKIFYLQLVPRTPQPSELTISSSNPMRAKGRRQIQ
jgi:hypothetical protein